MNEIYSFYFKGLTFLHYYFKVAHNLIKQQLLDYMYNGFIVPVLGPAILQVRTIL